MTCLTMITDDELLQKLAVYNNGYSDLATVKAEIIRRIVRKSQIRKADTDLIDQIIKMAKAIEEADFDLLHQSQRMKELSRQYHKLKNQLLSRMKNESNVLCQTT